MLLHRRGSLRASIPCIEKEYYVKEVGEVEPTRHTFKLRPSGMSSFKRRAQPAQSSHVLATRPSPATPSVLTVSTGIPSLDDLLGGGLPLGCVLIVLAPDPHSAYGELVQQYFIAQGLASGQNVCILDDSAMNLATSCLWMHSPETPGQPSHQVDEDTAGDGAKSEVKIAWRYGNMKQFQTSVAAPSQ